MGFGCDSRGDHYKLVRILSDDDHGVRAEVYNFGTDHSWREINFPTEVGSLFVYSHHVHYKGACYWLNLGLSNVVLSFDVGSEVFHAVPLPVDLHMLDLSPSSTLAVHVE
ncbi:F-box associated interaction domain containing protein [Trema orientale]|uniref:F-box associated interaction domain containing protein n=1 Tax=Trema orientale TaxID=63057 RepID=A0A2P5G0Q2_TREOI|nr:F-box associated interaction domain containing protein [Trema orientale]